MATDRDRSSLIDSVPSFIAAALTAITAVTGAIGGFTGGLSRLMRNEQGNFYWSVGLVAVAIIVSFVAAAAARRSPDLAKASQNVQVVPGEQDPGTANSARPPGIVRRKGYRWRRKLPTPLAFVSLLTYLVAGCVLVTGLVSSVEASDSPRIEVTWKTIGASQSLAATISVQLTGLKTSDLLYVTVDPGAVQGKPVQPTEHLYRSVTGADADGTADVTFDVPIPLGLAALQIVASVNESVDCEGKPTGQSQPLASSAPSTSPSPSPSGSLPPPIAGVKVSFKPTPRYGCVALLVPVATAAPATSATPSVSG